MKTLAKYTIAILMGASTFAPAMDEDGWASIYESIAAFEDRPGGDARIFNRPGYVKPIIENLGNVLNSNWYVSANVPQSLNFEFGLPISLISEKDVFGNSRDVPTIFGDKWDATADPANLNNFVYGNETLNGLGVFTYPYLQIGVSAFHARVVLRGMWLPAVSELRGFSLLGFSLQYSFGRWFQYMLPPAAQGLDVSLVFGYNSSSIGYRPKDYDGQLDLDVSATTFDLVIGYKPIEIVEVLLTLGYQSGSMASSGHLVSHAEGWNGQSIDPNITVDGNDGFKFGLAVAFQFGSSFHPVLGYDYAGKSSFTTNVLYFKQQFGKDKTPDEIAKEKGYVRGGSVSNDEEDTEETPKASKKKKSKKKKKVVEEEPEEEDAAGDTTAADDEFEEFDD